MILILNIAPEGKSTNITIKYLKKFLYVFSVAPKGIQIKEKKNFLEAINARKQRFLEISKIKKSPS